MKGREEVLRLLKEELKKPKRSKEEIEAEEELARKIRECYEDDED